MPGVNFCNFFGRMEQLSILYAGSMKFHLSFKS